MVDLQEDYRAWLDSLPDNLEPSRPGEKLQAVVDLDLDELFAVVTPRGYGRDCHQEKLLPCTATNLQNLTDTTEFENGLGCDGAGIATKIVWK